MYAPLLRTVTFEPSWKSRSATIAQSVVKFVGVIGVKANYFVVVIVCSVLAALTKVKFVLRNTLEVMPLY